LKSIIREVEEDEEEKHFVPHIENYDHKIELSDMNLRTESSKSKEEKEEDKEKNSNNNKSLFNSLNHNSNLNFQRNEKKRLSKNISISSSNKSPHGADENVFIHKLVNEENTIKKTHEKNSKIIRAKKNKVEKIITKDSKATDAEALILYLL